MNSFTASFISIESKSRNIKGILFLVNFHSERLDYSEQEGDEIVVNNETKEKLIKYIGDIPDIKINNGIKTGYNKAFVIDKKTKDDLIAKDENNAQIIKPVLRGRDILRWKVNFEEKYLIKIVNARISIER